MDVMFDLAVRRWALAGASSLLLLLPPTLPWNNPTAKTIRIVSALAAACGFTLCLKESQQWIKEAELGAMRWQANLAQYEEVLQAELVSPPQPQLSPASTAQAINPETTNSNNSNNWFAHAVDHGCVLVWGGQDSGKTTAASHIIKARKERGDRVVVLDPHAEKGQWEGLEVIGAGMDYKAIDEFMKWYFEECGRRYKLLRAEGKEAVKKLGSICLVAEELTNFAERCKNSAEFIKACLSDNRKILFNCLFIAHGRTLTLIGGSKGTAQTRDDSFLELHCIPPTGGSSRQWSIRYPGSREFLPVAIPNWETIFNFSFESQVADGSKLLLSLGSKALLEFMSRTNRREAKISEIQPNFKYQGQRFSVEDLKRFLNELAENGLAVWTSSDTILLNCQTDRQNGQNQTEPLYSNGQSYADLGQN
jgi:ATP:corrinoid adenosyltransferase